jgi:glutamate-ammonia-ligase adenylyltransferase
VQRIIHLLTARTGAGDLYEVDTRLRPSGRAGLLVSSFEAFAEYQRRQAWTWEHQALTRTRVVAGPAANWSNATKPSAGRYCGIERDPDPLRQEVREMRERMRAELDTSNVEIFDLKQGRGGIADIEFMVQYEISGERQPLSGPVDLYRQYSADSTDWSGSASCPSPMPPGCATLTEALRRRIHLLKLQEQPARIPVAEASDAREGVIRIWRRLMESD